MKQNTRKLYMAQNKIPVSDFFNNFLKKSQLATYQAFIAFLELHVEQFMMSFITR